LKSVAALSKLGDVAGNDFKSFIGCSEQRVNVFILDGAIIAQFFALLHFSGFQDFSLQLAAFAL
jgi:hypothetical protein